MTKEEEKEPTGYRALHCLIPASLHQALRERAGYGNMTSLVVEGIKLVLQNPDLKIPHLMLESQKHEIFREAYAEFRKSHSNQPPTAAEMAPYLEKHGLNMSTTTIGRRCAELGLPIRDARKKLKEAEENIQREIREQVKRELTPLLERHRQGDKDAPKHIEEILDTYPISPSGDEEGYPYGCPLCTYCYNTKEKRLAHVLGDHKTVNRQH
ncbi:hypothetical protein MUP05_00700 [Candidatus Bathyarchaeota archaeon]|nr:hypothetical protein [Candidatus Bathyarchaeota archaeon]